MEEKKSKTVKMNTVQGNQEEKRQKLTYEQLNDACNQLFQQNQQLIKQVRELNMVNMFKRLDYLFKVVELASTFKDADFVNSCIDEIKDSLIIKDEEPEKEEKQED